MAKVPRGMGDSGSGQACTGGWREGSVGGQQGGDLCRRRCTRAVLMVTVVVVRQGGELREFEKLANEQACEQKTSRALEQEPQINRWVKRQLREQEEGHHTSSGSQP